MAEKKYIVTKSQLNRLVTKSQLNRLVTKAKQYKITPEDDNMKMLHNMGTFIKMAADKGISTQHELDLLKARIAYASKACNKLIKEHYEKLFGAGSIK